MSIVRQLVFISLVFFGQAISAMSEKMMQEMANQRQQALRYPCGICLDDEFSREDLVNLSCQHAYCRGCLNRTVDTAIQEKNIKGFKCPEPSCTAPMTEQDIRAITQDPAKVEQYSTIATNAWAVQQPGYKACPTANCPYYFFNERNDRGTTRCPSCRQEYCASCLLRHGNLMSCEEAAAEAAMTQGDRERANEEWKRTHTKPCPHCKAPIEKNEGCPHMRCANPVCHYEFCWECLGDWQGIDPQTGRYPDHYNCGRNW